MANNSSSVNERDRSTSGIESSDSEVENSLQQHDSYPVITSSTSVGPDTIVGNPDQIAVAVAYRADGRILETEITFNITPSGEAQIGDVSGDGTRAQQYIPIAFAAQKVSQNPVVSRIPAVPTVNFVHKQLSDTAELREESRSNVTPTPQEAVNDASVNGDMASQTTPEAQSQPQDTTQTQQTTSQQNAAASGERPNQTASTSNESTGGESDEDVDVEVRTTPTASSDDIGDIDEEPDTHTQGQPSATSGDVGVEDQNDGGESKDAGVSENAGNSGNVSPTDRSIEDVAEEQQEAESEKPEQTETTEEDISDGVVDTQQADRVETDAEESEVEQDEDEKDDDGDSVDEPLRSFDHLSEEKEDIIDLFDVDTANGWVELDRGEKDGFLVACGHEESGHTLSVWLTVDVVSDDAQIDIEEKPYMIHYEYGEDGESEKDYCKNVERCEDIISDLMANRP